MTKIFPVVLSGGTGTRLWPVSRKSMPKQFAKIAADDCSTYQRSLQRVSNRDVFENITVLTSVESRFIAAEQRDELGLAAEIILEPQGRDSAAAVAVAAIHVARVDPSAIVLITAADHIVKNTEAFSEAVLAAAAGARDGFIMTLGIKPDRPATEYGYISPGEELSSRLDGHKITQFVEKPNIEAAEQLIIGGALWNSGYFLFRADVMLVELEKYAPDVLTGAKYAYNDSLRDLDFLRLNEEGFIKAPRISIDYAVMERTSRAGVLPVSFDWSDIGTWNGLWKILAHDSDGNAVQGRIIALDTKNSLIQNFTSGVAAVAGVENIIVVVTPDAVLVTNKNNAASVKQLVENLEKLGAPEVNEHLRMHRPWGWYQRVDVGDRFQVKRIQVSPSKQLSLQKHFHRAEHWVVVKGTARVEVGGEIKLIHENEAVYLPIGSTHRLSNPGKIPLELIEVQVGSYTGEDDIIRLEDDHGRV